MQKLIFGSKRLVYLNSFGRKTLRKSHKAVSKLVVLLLVVCIFCIVGAGIFAYSFTRGNPFDFSGSQSANPIIEYATERGLSLDLVKKLESIGEYSNIISYENYLVNELVIMGEYANTDFIHGIVDSIVDDGVVTYEEYHWIMDPDDDYVINEIEMEKNTDPTDAYTSGLDLDDYNAIFTYEVDPNNQNEVNKILENIPNVNVRLWKNSDTRIPRGPESYVEPSLNDPLMIYLAKRSEIRWENNAAGKVGVLYVDGRTAYSHGEDDMTGSVEQPSYYFTTDRIGHCVESAIANIVILKLMNYQTKYCSGYISNNDGTIGHGWCEVIIDGDPYVVNFNILIPREDYYDHREWELDSSYDPDWYKK